MRCDYIDHMGSDLTVANAARVSFNKHKDEFDESDEKLINYLASHKHWTPFSHPQIEVRMKAPIFVARQLFKHKVGLTENEISRRYVDDTPEFFTPEVWRGRPTDGAKQGSDGEAGYDGIRYLQLLASSLQCYYSMLDAGVAPEQARMVLPQSMYTEWYWTGSLAAFSRVYSLRSDPHAQKETQEVAAMLDTIIRPLFPVSWKALVDEVQK